MNSVDIFDTASDFSFENFARNKKLEEQDTANIAEWIKNNVKKTGTTITGLVFKDGLVLGADTRATAGDIVCDKHCMKLHYIYDNIYCAGAGLAADCDHITKIMSSKMSLHAQLIGRKPRVVTCQRYLRQYLAGYMGYLSAYIVMGGVDEEGSHLYQISANGTVAKLPYVTMGSGTFASLCHIESKYKPDMSKEEAVKVIYDAVRGGVFNDLGSGSDVDIVVITKDKVDYMKPYEHASTKGVRQGEYLLPKGTTEVLSQRVKDIEYDVLDKSTKSIPMETG